MFTALQLLDKINAHVESMPYLRAPQELYNPIKYVLSLGGKRIRPVLMLMAYNLYKEDVESILGPAAGIETYHNHTLLHDDLMDKAEVRRGKPTVHMAWNDNTAILSGDAMLLLAYRFMATCPEPYLKRAMAVFTETAIEICEGQQYDMDFEHRADVTESEYIEMIRLKTSVLLAASLKIGAILGDASDEDCEALYDLGVHMGLAFQLQDDLLDVYADPKVFGKKLGGDILSNKKTYMLIKTLETVNDAQRAELDKWLEATDFVPEEKIAAVTAIYNQVGIRHYCEKLMQHYYELALNDLQKVKVPIDKKQGLRLFMDEMMNRQK